MPATFETFTSVHAFKIFDTIEKLLELLELDDILDPSNVSAEFGVKDHTDEQGNFQGNYLHIGFRLDGRMSFHEIPIDYRVPEELKYDKLSTRSAYEAWKYKKTL